MMQFTPEELKTMTFVGIDAHPTEHTALAVNRYEEEKGHFRFENTKEGIEQFKAWLTSVEKQAHQVIIGVEGGSTARHALLFNILETYKHLYEVNPLYTKQRRTFGTKGDKSDKEDAKLIAEILTRKLNHLPRIIPQELGSYMLSLKKRVWYYEETAVQGARLKNQLHKLRREEDLSINQEEKQFLQLIISEKEAELKAAKKTKYKLEKELAIQLASYGQNLTTVVGLGTVLVARLLAHTNNIERFKTQAKYIRYAGISPRERSSGKSKRHIANTKGNRKLNSVFYLAALSQIKNNEKAKVYYQKKIAQGKTKRQALVAVTRNLAIIVYQMLRSGEEYRASQLQAGHRK
jgi:transposase